MKDDDIIDLIRLATLEAEFELCDQEVDAILARPLPQPPTGKLERYKLRLVRLQQDLAIRKALGLTKHENRTIGRYLEFVREQACLSRGDIAERLGKNVDFVQKVETGDWDLHELTPQETADFVELFQINIPCLANLAKNSYGANVVKSTFRVAARSHGGKQVDVRAEDVDKALDAFVRKMHLSRTQELPALVALCIEKVRSELIKRGRKDLLE